MHRNTIFPFKAVQVKDETFRDEVYLLSKEASVGNPTEIELNHVSPFDGSINRISYKRINLAKLILTLYISHWVNFKY